VQTSKKIFKLLTISLIYFSLIVIIFQKNVAANSALGINTVLPSTQVEASKDQTYYDIKLKPAQKETLIVKLTNNSDQPIKVEAVVSSAITNDNGVVEYGNESKKKDESLKYPLPTLANWNKQVEIPARTTIDYPIEVTMPKKKFSGLITGGILLSEEEDQTQESGSALQNKINYTLAIVLRGTPDYVKSNLKLTKVFADLDNDHNSLNANLQNPTAAYVNITKSTVKVYKKGDKSKPLFTDLQQSKQVAPNTNFNYNFPLGDGKKIDPGEYIWIQDVESDESSWHFEKTFRIGSKTARVMNKKDVTIERIVYWLWIIVVIILIIMVGTTIIVVIIKKKRK